MVLHPTATPSFLAMLQEEEKSIVTEERMFNDHVGEVLIALRSPDIRAFSSSEIKVLALVKEKFNSYSAKQLSDLSHKEKGYLETHDRELISYDHASRLLCSLCSLPSPAPLVRIRNSWEQSGSAGPENADPTYPS